MKLVKWLLLTSTAALLAVAAFIYAGIYPMGADVPHNRITYWLLETVRERSDVSQYVRFWTSPVERDAILDGSGHGSIDGRHHAELYAEHVQK